MNKNTNITAKSHGCAFSYGAISANTWAPGHPLTINGCMIMMCGKGHAIISINSQKYKMKPGSVAFMAFDMVVIPEKISSDFNARFLSMDFNITQDLFLLVTSNRFWDFIYKTPVFMAAHEPAGKIKSWFSIIKWIDAECSPATKEKVLRNEVESYILIMAEQVESRLGQLRENPSKNRAWALYNDFLALLNRNYASHHDVAFYADKLHVTPNYLNIIVRRMNAISAKEQINKQIGLVIRTLLDTTDLSVKQIAERLHYEDPSYLCRIFRKQTGMTPMQYRNKLKI